MGNPKKKFNDFDSLRQLFDSDDPIFRGVGVFGNGQAGHEERVANTPEWVRDNAQVRAVLLRAFPKLGTNLTQRARAARWMFIINRYFLMGREASKIAMELRHLEAWKSGQTLL